MENSKRTRPILYFLCTGNSCRSQMAEGFAHNFIGKEVEIYSAGVVASGVYPLAIRVMKEEGIDISSQALRSLMKKY